MSVQMRAQPAGAYAVGGQAAGALDRLGGGRAALASGTAVAGGPAVLDSRRATAGPVG